MKSWLMLNDYSALNTMFRKTPQKQTSFVSPKGNEKQIDYILTKRRYLRNVKDAEANDMIHMGSDHRCVMATFLINTPEKKTNVRRENKKHETIVYVEHEQKEKTSISKCPSSKKIRAAWATSHKYRQELTSKNYMLKHRLQFFDATVFSDHLLRRGNMDSEQRTRKNDSIDATQDATTHYPDKK